MPETILLSQRRQRPLLRGAGVTFLFFIALIIGLALFAPWAKVWSSALHLVIKKTPQLQAQWTDINEAGMFHFRITGLKVHSPQSVFAADEAYVKFGLTPVIIKGLQLDFDKTKTVIKEATLRVGLSPLLHLQLDTGPELHVRLFEGKKLTVHGAADLANLLAGRRITGTMKVLADCRWKKEWKHYPDAGSIELFAKSLTLPPDKAHTSVSLYLDLEGQRATIRKHSVKAPLPVRAQGFVELHSNPLSSRVTIDGKIGDGENAVSFSHQNKRLERLLF